MKNRILLFITVLTLAACTQVRSEEFFIRREQARDGVYVFDISMPDSTASYDFWFYSRADRTELSNVQLRVRWISPDGESFSEDVYMRSIARNGSKELYRKDVMPAVTGDWTLSVRPVDTDKDFSGMGLIMIKNDGTR